MQRDEVQSWVLSVARELFAKGQKMGFPATAHADLFDDNFAGRVASFELDARGNLVWFNFRDDAIERASWPMKLVVTFGEEGDRLAVWVRSNRFQEVRPLVRMS